MKTVYGALLKSGPSPVDGCRTAVELLNFSVVHQTTRWAVHRLVCRLLEICSEGREAAPSTVPSTLESPTECSL